MKEEKRNYNLLIVILLVVIAAIGVATVCTLNQIKTNTAVLNEEVLFVDDGTESGDGNIAGEGYASSVIIEKCKKAGGHWAMGYCSKRRL